jgi:hypothetical protein
LKLDGHVLPAKQIQIQVTQVFCNRLNQVWHTACAVVGHRCQVKLLGTRQSPCC